jgi:dTDP-4-amino-4,6-dideoxygalactose transaminase
MVEELPGGRGVYHLAVVRVKDRPRVQHRLTSMGVQTGIHYPIPCHRLAPYRRFVDGPLPNAEAAAGEILSLPMFPHMSDDQVDRVCEALHEALATEEVGIA